MSVFSRTRISETCALYIGILREDPCCFCGRRVMPYVGKKAKVRKGMTIDHIVPQGEGGSKTSWKNLTAACDNCNNDKADMGLLRFLMKRRRVLGKRWH